MRERLLTVNNEYIKKYGSRKGRRCTHMGLKTNGETMDAVIFFNVKVKWDGSQITLTCKKIS